MTKKNNPAVSENKIIEAPPKAKPPSIREQLQGENFKKAIAEILPEHVTPERMVRVAIAATTRTPELANADPASFFKAMMILSEHGIEPDGRRAHLIPFRNNKRNCIEVQLILDYKGIVELLMRTGNVSRIHCDTVCENDVFEVDRGEVVAHRVNYREPRGEMYAAYCLIQFKDGVQKAEVMTRGEIDAIRSRSRAGQSGPWVTDYSEMAKKTVFRRASKWVPLSSEIRDALHSDDDQFRQQHVHEVRPGNTLDSVTKQIEKHLEAVDG